MYTNEDSLPLVMDAPPSYMRIAIFSLGLHHEMCHLNVFTSLIRSHTRWQTVLSDSVKEGMEYCISTVVGGCSQVHHKAAEAINSTMYNKSPACLKEEKK